MKPTAKFRNSASWSWTTTATRPAAWRSSCGSWGNVVHAVHDGESALTAAKEIRPQVILCDIGLPNANGYEVCRSLRLESWGTELVLVAVTGWGQDEDRRNAREAGFDHHMTKPVDPRALMKWLARLDFPVSDSTKERGTTDHAG